MALCRSTSSGVHFSTTHANILAPHYARKELAARSAANAALSLESHVGAVPPQATRTLYYGHVEPHLTFGCEVAVDVSSSCLAPLESLQHAYLRRLLGASAHSQIPPLFTETGIWPVRYRRMELVLRYAKYVVRDGPTFPKLALREAVQNASAARSSWWGDVQHALAALPVPVRLQDWHRGPSLENLTSAIRDLSSSLAQHLYEGTMASARLPVIQARFRSLSPASCLRFISSWRPYLSVTCASHRTALVRLVMSEHPLAVEVLRRSPLDIPRDRRVCRLCRAGIEDEVHALFHCEADVLVRLRADFFSKMREEFRVDLTYLLSVSLMRPGEVLALLLERPEVAAVLGDYVQLVFHTVQLVPPLVLTEQVDRVDTRDDTSMAL